jgi:hypothetical protein
MAHCKWSPVCKNRSRYPTSTSTDRVGECQVIWEKDEWKFGIFISTTLPQGFGNRKLSFFLSPNVSPPPETTQQEPRATTASWRHDSLWVSCIPHVALPFNRNQFWKECRLAVFLWHDSSFSYFPGFRKKFPCLPPTILKKNWILRNVKTFYY